MVDYLCFTSIYEQNLDYVLNEYYIYTNTIRLFALDFSVCVTVDSGCALVNCHAIEISSSKSFFFQFVQMSNLCNVLSINRDDSRVQIIKAIKQSNDGAFTAA